MFAGKVKEIDHSLWIVAFPFDALFLLVTEAYWWVMHDKQEMYERRCNHLVPLSFLRKNLFCSQPELPCCTSSVASTMWEPKVVAEAPGVVLGSTQVSFLPQVFAVGKSDKKMRIEGGIFKEEIIARPRKNPSSSAMRPYWAIFPAAVTAGVSRCDVWDVLYVFILFKIPKPWWHTLFPAVASSWGVLLVCCKGIF